MKPTLERTGVLIVRLWIEVNHDQGLRARITQTLDTGAGEQSIAVATSAEGICAVVKEWVQDFATLGPSGGNGRGGPAEEA
ncbi:MAG TPA: hypothetical protein VM841_06915 [Actinomycetota bacterium]|nr:hypothetical protein [Actinomycetota bacterium]